MAKVIFFQAHPDDLELECANLIHYLATKSKNKHIVKIASMTKGEFGLPGPRYDKFKGDFLAKVRTRELQKAQSIHGIPPENIDFFGYIDGFVKFNREFVNKIANYLKKEKPDIVFAPEPLYTYYYHMDHVNTGRALFYIIYNKLIDKKPILYYFSAFRGNFRFPFDKSGFELEDQLISCHKTQFWLLNYMKVVYRPFARIAGSHVSGWKYAEPYRRIYFKKENLKKNKQTLWIQVWTHFFSSLPWFKAKYPQAILEKLKSEGYKI